MSEEDKELVKRLYGLKDSDMCSVEKLHIRSGMSICAAAKVVASHKN